MPAKWFICPDGKQIEISKCLENRGCRMYMRCATRPYLRLIGYDREWKGVSPSAAGTGPRCLYLKAVTDYAIDPNNRAFAAHGTGVHGKLSIHKFTYNVLSEEKLSSKEMEGIADILEEDEWKVGYYILSDYKTWGSFKVAKAQGIIKRDVKVCDENGKPIRYKSGKRKGQIKTRKEIVLSPDKADIQETALQINRYRIFFEKAGFPISRMQVQMLIRDGGTQAAFSRGVNKNLGLIDIPRIPDDQVLDFYDILQKEVDEAFRLGWVRLCNDWESWDGRRCKGFCEVSEACKQMGGK